MHLQSIDRRCHHRSPRALHHSPRIFLLGCMVFCVRLAYDSWVALSAERIHTWLICITWVDVKLWTM